MRVLIADDEPVAREILRDLVQLLPGLELVGEAASGTEAAAGIFELRPDLALLDLEMPEMNGLSLVRSLSQEPKPLIIFVTAYDQHALDAFDVGAVDYLLKPVRRERFEKAIEKARRLHEVTAPSVVPVPPTTAPERFLDQAKKIAARRGSDIYLIQLSEVVAFQAEGELVHLITATDRYLCDDSLKTLETTLGQGPFRRIHRGTIINTDHIRKISPLSSHRWLLKMSNGFEAVVSKRLASSIRQQGPW